MLFIAMTTSFRICWAIVSTTEKIAVTSGVARSDDSYFFHALFSYHKLKNFCFL
ncbi:hypothetical protein HMPREF0083_01419 [Aneurinibacillus aneurinilyticus ATCC 12856]|uniref:Uncharacterized protein n=1 Tax=Aneurinibacillus aneurinilyticus ATCC 12856 TaxID=649747 RepID=U1X7I8_ANEAE|nr:hypothetical protein HMPREF0083_01419 [Aneurinibacillus aneurinilyticus ATCC 12856]